LTGVRTWKTTAGVSPAADRERDLAIDMAKGCAILWVLLIHSQALGDTLLFRQVVNQAVPVFVVLFGLNSSLWWHGRPLGPSLEPWYRRAVRRILWPAWGALVLWWPMVLYYRPFGVPLSWPLPFVQACGYLLHVGTGWFVTMILQMVALFPAFEWIRRRTGMALLLPVGLVATCATTQIGFAIVEAVGLFNYWILSPRFFAHVTAGMLVAQHRARLGASVGAGAAGAFALCVAADVAGLGAPWQQQAEALGGIPLAVLLLAGLRPLAGVPVLAPGLAWLGRSSYGIYIGQLITHNFFVYRLGLTGLPEKVDPWAYTGILMAGGLFFVWLGERLLAVVPRRGGAPNARNALDTPVVGGGS
jgi:peptidoglycan/LPS O-acetylase OafA/YrhL